jgi:hypothetical protein
MLFRQHFVDVCRHFEIDAQSVEMRPTAIDFMYPHPGWTASLAPQIALMFCIREQEIR